MANAGTFGFISGIGQQQRYYNEQEYQNELEGEKNANSGTVKILESLLQRPDLDEATKNTALGSLLQFSQTKGRPTAKHRQAAMEPVVKSMATPRPGPGATQLEQTAQSTESQPFTPNTPGAGGTYTSPTSGETPLEQVNPAIHAQSIRKVESMVPTRTGLMRPDEMGTRYKAEMDAMYGGGGGADGMGIAPSSRFTMGPKGPSMSMSQHFYAPSQANYTLDDGSSGFGTFIPDERGGHVISTLGQDVTAHVTRLEPRGGMMTPQTVADASGAPQRQMFNRLTGTPGAVLGKVPVRQTFFTGYDENGQKIETPANAYTAHGPITNIGGAPFASARALGMRLSNESKSYQLTGRFSDGSIPAWAPTTTDANGNVTPIPGVTSKLVFNAANNRKAQAAIQTTDMIDFLRGHMGAIEHKFGTFGGTIEELTSKYINDPDVRAIAPIIKEHLPSAISGMYGFRAYQSKLDYGNAIDGAFHTFLGQPIGNVRAALDSTYEIAKKARDEATNPYYQNAGVGNAGPVPGRTNRGDQSVVHVIRGADGKLHIAGH